MTEEEKKAIENIDKRLTIEKYTKNIATPVYLSDLKTILNLIKNQQSEKEQLKAEIQTLETTLQGYQVLSNVIDVKQTELEKKEQLYKKALSDLVKAEKIIDLMADMLTALMTDITVVKKQFEEEYCEFINSDEDCCWKNKTECSDCIKQYFEKQVEN